MGSHADCFGYWETIGEIGLEGSDCNSFPGLDAQNYAAEIKIRAERKAGELLAKMEKAKGGRPSEKNLSQSVTGLSELGINRMQSSRWQTMAAVPATAFDELVSEIHHGGKELTKGGVP